MCENDFYDPYYDNDYSGIDEDLESDPENDIFEIPGVKQEILFRFNNHTCNQCYCYFPKTNDNAYIEKYTCKNCLKEYNYNRI